MSTEGLSDSKDVSVLQLLTRLVVETERLVRLADDINQHATTPQAKAAINLIGTEVTGILGTIKTTINPLYNLYEIDAGLKAAREQSGADHPSAPTSKAAEYDETALWSEVKKPKE